MRELRMPHRFVRADPVQEDDRRRVAAAGLVDSRSNSRLLVSTRPMLLHLGSGAGGRASLPP